MDCYGTHQNNQLASRILQRLYFLDSRLARFFELLLLLNFSVGRRGSVESIMCYRVRRRAGGRNESALASGGSSDGVRLAVPCLSGAEGFSGHQLAACLANPCGKRARTAFGGRNSQENP